MSLVDVVDLSLNKRLNAEWAKFGYIPKMYLLALNFPESRRSRPMFTVEV